jgi:CRP-like cAMP-binding protein
MELWQLHLVMAFSCLLTFTLAVAAIRRYFLGRRHLQSEFQGPRRKGDGPISRSEKQIAAESVATNAIALTEKFAVDKAALSVEVADVVVKELQDSQFPSSTDHEHVAAIRHFPSLQTASESELQRLSQHVRLVSLAAGETIFTAGAVASTAYVIKTGSVSLVTSGVDNVGHEAFTKLISAGDPFGEEALESAEVYSCTAVATCACQLWILERNKMALALSSAQELAKRAVFHNVTLKSVATVARTSAHLSLNHGGIRTEPVELLGLSVAAPSLLPQQQAPCSLISTRADLREQPLDFSSSMSNSSAVLQESLPSAAGGSVSRVPKSLLKKHAMLFDSESNEL